MLSKTGRTCTLVEITVCFDMYLEQAFEEKVIRYQPIVDRLILNGYSAKLLVMCFGSLGSVHKNAWTALREFSNDKTGIKALLKWCSISNIIGANYIWRSRVKKVLS